MARRSDHNREELYDLILKAATEIVEKKGLRALTARSVAERIGYSAGTLYNLFENLDDLIVHLRGRILDELHDRAAAVEMTGNVSADLAALVDIYLAYLETHPNLWLSLFDHTPPEGKALPDWYLAKVAKALGLVETALSPLFETGDGRERADVARLLWACLHGITSLAQSGKLQGITGQSAKEMADSLVVNFVAGLRLNREQA